MLLIIVFLLGIISLTLGGFSSKNRESRAFCFLVFNGKAKTIGFFLASLAFQITATVHSQEHPPIQNFTPLDYQAENQNWSISQDANQFIYVANNKGLLEFNGAVWTLYSSPNNTIFRSVKVIGDKIFTGFYMDFGYWLRDDAGVLKFTSLVDSLHIKLLEDEQFWNILHIDDWILFQSLQRIYMYNTKSNQVRYIQSSSKITKIFEVDEVVYFHKKREGIYLIDEGKEKLFSNFYVFKENNVIDMYQKEGALMILTDTNGFYEIKNGTIQSKKLPDLDLSNYTIYNSKRLNNGDYALGTISAGILFLDPEGNIQYRISQENGINNNTVLSVFEDQDLNVWVGLDNGISMINRNSNISIYENRNGALGTIYASAIFNGNLYLGTNQGLFYKKYNSNDPFTFIEGTQGQVWNLSQLDGDLFCSHDSGIFVVNNSTVKYRINTPGTWSVKNTFNPQILISGDYIGLSVLIKKNGKWGIRNKIVGFSNSSKYFEFYRPNEIFVNHEYKGVFRLLLDKNYTKVIKTVKDNSINKGLHSSIVKYRNDILYGNHQGVFVFDSVKSQFKKDEVLSKMYSDSTFVSGKLLYDEERDILWGFSTKYISYVAPSKLSDNLEVHKVPIKKPLRKGATGYENISLLPSGKNLKGSYNGYIVFDIKTPPINIDKAVIIGSVKVKDNNENFLNLSLSNNSILEYENNNIQFNFSVTNYDVYQDIEYQYSLSDPSDKWSAWTTKPYVNFENLSFGEYTFKVRSKIGNTISEHIASYSFQIKRPWYLSTMMIAGYTIGFILIIIAIQIANRRHYKKKSRKQLEKQQREFELHELEKEKEFVMLKNEQLKIDVESKNRELATSTMSMIKKNEFLHTIKNELKKVEASGVSRVIKIINKNLNNNDDWKLFEEAFNNADKDFIKKVKSMHPDLTPNDLKLCAYLRLNLPSKEIAPLLNISPRSVEVKRYRLRKKMNLNHKENLTEYILNV